MLGHQIPAMMDFDAFEAVLSRMPEDEAWELVSGQVAVSKVGHTCGHNMLGQNVAYEIMTQLRAKGAPYHTFVLSFYLKSRARRSALLPHVMVRRGRLSPGATPCDDPVAIVEVCEWGETGGRKDRWAACRHFPTLRHYVVVESGVPLVRVHDRAETVQREARILEGFDATLDLAALDVSIPLAEIYEDVLSA